MAEQQMTLEDWLDDLCVRFIINLPSEDLSSVARICFQIEEAQWFYEDFIRPLDARLPTMTLRTFCLRMFQHCPLLAAFSAEHQMQAFDEFMQYKTRIPVRGAIMLNAAMDSAVLVKGWKKAASWSFPRGKINKDEDDLDCAVREVYEETGLDLEAADLVPEPEEVKYIEVTMREQQLRLYVFKNVPMDTHFEPRTRKEISKIDWYKLSDLPSFRKKNQDHQASGEAIAAHANKFYMVAPFLGPLKKWIAQQKRRSAPLSEPHALVEEPATEDELQHAPQMPQVTPSIGVQGDATRELHRMLSIQPHTAPAVQPVAQSRDKGLDLLAILQAPTTQPPSTQLRPLPHTPLDLLHNVVPEPRNPHHSHNVVHQPMQTQQRPPAFNAPPSRNQPTEPQQTPTQYHGVFTTHGQHRQPGILPYQQAQMPQPRPPVHHQHAPQPYYPIQHVQQRHPLPPPPPQQQQPPQQPQQQRPTYKSPVLAHPQPLPPQANSILASAILPTPAPQANGFGAAPAQGVSVYTTATNQAQRVAVGPAPPHHVQAHSMPHNVASAPLQQPLGDRQLSLLSAFKQNNTSTSQGAVPPNATQILPQSAQAQNINWAPLTSTYGATTALPSSTSKQLNDLLVRSSKPLSVAGSTPGTKQPMVSAVQQRTLLDMFKQTTSLDASKLDTAQVSDLASHSPAAPNLLSVLQQKPQQPTQSMPPQKEPDVSQSLAGLSILTKATIQAPSTYGQPQGVGAAYKPASSPYGNMPYASQSSASVAALPSQITQRPEAPADQRNKLMSLFSQPRTIPSAGSDQIHQSIHGSTSQSQHQASAGTPLGVVPAPAGGVVAVRRDSQPQGAITPENEKFLLSFLQSVSGGAKGGR